MRRELSRARLAAHLASAALVCASVFLRGGVGIPAQAIVLVLAVATLMAATVRPSEPLRVPPFLGALALALAMAIVQLVPMPPLAVRLLSPTALELFRTALEPIGLYPAARPLALDPLAAWRELATVAAMVAAAGAAAALGGTKRGVRSVVRPISLVGATAVVVVLAAAALGLGPYVEPRLVFVNPNHFAAFLAVATWPALGLALRETGRARALWAAAFALCGLGTFITLSRAGIAAFFVGAGAFAVLLRRRADEEGNRPGWQRHAVVPAAAAVVLAAASFVALERVIGELRTVAAAASDARAALWPGAVEVILRHPLVGVGRGGFGPAFSRLRLDSDPYTYTHVENDWLQLPVDLGIPVALAVGVAGVWTWLSVARRRDLSRPEIGALAGLAALAAHALFDFPSHVAGVAIPAALVMGVLAAGRGPPLRPNVWRAAAVAALVAGIAGLAWHAATASAAGADPIHRASTREDVVARARAAAALSPADFLPHAVAGARLVELDRCSDAMPWLVRAMWLAPAVPEPHRYAARCLAAAGRPAEARSEYRLASLLGDARALDEAARWYPSTEDILALAPETPTGASAAAQLLARLGRHGDAAAAFARAYEQYGDPADLAAASEHHLAAGDAATARAAAARLEEVEPNGARPYLLASGALARLRDPEGAMRVLERGLERVPGSPEVAFALADLLVVSRRYSHAIRTVDAASQPTTAHAVRGSLIKVAALRAQGRLSEAIAVARSARDTDPRAEEAYVALADALADAGKYADAADVLRGATTLSQDASRRLAARLEALRQGSPRRDAAPERRAGSSADP